MSSEIDRINELRLRVRDGLPITKDEAREALELMRAQRKTTMDAQATKAAKAAPINLNDLFD